MGQSEKIAKEVLDLVNNTIDEWGIAKTRGSSTKSLGLNELKSKSISKEDLAAKFMTFYHLLTKLYNSHEDLVDENSRLKEKVKAKDTGDGIKTAVKDLLPGVVTQVVKEIVKADSKGKMSWAEVFKTNLKEELVGGMNKTFEETIGTQLAKNQNEIMRKTAQKQDQDYYERERRARNVVISNVEESTAANNHERISYDKDVASTILDVPTDDIVKVFRAGDQPGKGRNKDRTKPRLLIITMKSPEMAKSRHNYGMGVKKLPDQRTSSFLHEGDSCFWINPDLSRTERIANYEARKLRNQRRQGGGNENRPTSFPKPTGEEET